GTRRWPRGVVFGLWFRIGTIQKEGYDLLEGLGANIHGAVDAIARLHPAHFPGSDFPGQSVSAIAELNADQVPAQHHGHPMIGITVPPRRLSRVQPLPPNQAIPAMMQYLLSSHRSLGCLFPHHPPGEPMGLIVNVHSVMSSGK